MSTGGVGDAIPVSSGSSPEIDLNDHRCLCHYLAAQVKWFIRFFRSFDLLSRHAEGCSIIKGENNAKGFVSIMVYDVHT